MEHASESGVDPAVLEVPPDWGCIELLSDVHLHPSEPATLRAWQLALASSQADAVLILGDLFEVWVGDDALHEPGSFEALCGQSLRACSSQRAVYLMHGNRDFLIGQQAASQWGVQLLNDPTVLVWGHTRTLLSHGDALCTDDLPYQAFRQLVRQAAWQTAFLSQSLSERRAMAAGLRAESEARKAMGNAIDLHPEAGGQWLAHAQAKLMVHGHTHQATHAPWGGQMRHVLSDWDALATPPRLSVLQLLRPQAGQSRPAHRLRQIELPRQA